jgi:hypothetical protein
MGVPVIVWCIFVDLGPEHMRDSENVGIPCYPHTLKVLAKRSASLPRPENSNGAHTRKETR